MEDKNVIPEVATCIQYVCMKNGNDKFRFSNEDGTTITTIDEFIAAQKVFFHNSLNNLCDYANATFPFEEHTEITCVRLFTPNPRMSRIGLMDPDGGQVFLHNIETVQEAIRINEFAGKVVFLF